MKLWMCLFMLPLLANGFDKRQFPVWDLMSDSLDLDMGAVRIHPVRRPSYDDFSKLALESTAMDEEEKALYKPWESVGKVEESPEASGAFLTLDGMESVLSAFPTVTEEKCLSSKNPSIIDGTD